MLSELLPNPDLHDDWRSFARALLSSLEGLTQQAVGPEYVQYVQTTSPIDPGQLPQFPAGWTPIWLNTNDLLLYMGNSAYDPPTAPDIVFIDTAMIADAAIEANKVADLAIEARAIIAGAVSELKLADDAVTAAKIATAAINADEIAAGAVESAKILDLAVVTAKIAHGAVNSLQVANAAIVEAKIGNAAVTTAKIQDLAVVNAKIADLTILSGKIVDGTIVTAKIADAAIVTALIGDLQVVTAKLGDLAVNEAKIANAAISSAKIGNLAVGATHIQAAAIGTAHIADAAIVNAKIGSVIQSAGWNDVTKAGWKIDKDGLIQGQGVAIYDTAGNLVFGSGGQLAWNRITGAPVIENPDILAVHEKQGWFIENYNDLEARYQELKARADALFLGTTALDAARTAWLDLLTSWGQELVTNGTFEVDTSGWTAGGSTLSVVGGRLRVTKTGTGSGYGYQVINGLTVGRRYSLTGTAITGTCNGRIRFGSGSNPGANNYGEINNTTATVEFTATSTALSITAYAYEFSTAGLYSEFDDISVKETPATAPWDKLDDDTTIYEHLLADQLFPTGWNAVGTITAVPNGGYITVTDNDASRIADYRRDGASSGVSQFTAGLVVRKDAVPRATRFPGLYIAGVGGTTKAAVIKLDTSTGEINHDNPANLDASGVHDMGDAWLIWGTVTTNADNTFFRTLIYPARGAGTSWNNVAATLGSIDIKPPLVVRGDWKNLGREMLKARQMAYFRELATLAKSISEVDFANIQYLAPGQKTSATNWAEAESMANDLSAMRGYAQFAGCVGGAGKPLYKVLNESMDANVPNSFPWCVEQAKAAGGGRIIFSPYREMRIYLAAQYNGLIGAANLTIDAPGRNVTFLAPRNIHMLRLGSTSGRSDNTILRRLTFERTLSDAAEFDAINALPEWMDKIWFDELTFRNHGDGAIDISSSAYDTTSPQCRFTISNSKFLFQDKTLTIGSTKTSTDPAPSWAATALDQTPRILGTLDSNFFEGASQRGPRVGALAFVHSINNVRQLSRYRRDDGVLAASNGIYATTGGKALSEGDYFRLASPDAGVEAIKVDTAAWNDTTNIGPGATKVNGSVAEDALPMATANEAKVPAPPYSIPVTPIPAGAEAREDLVDTIRASTGAEVRAVPDANYTFVTKATGDASGIYVDGHHTFRVRGGYIRRLSTEASDPSAYTDLLVGTPLTSLTHNILGQFTTGNISTYIAGAAIGTALIANAAITTALIADLAVSSAKIQDLAVTNAKIQSVDAAKINAASLSAITAVVGLLRTATSGARLEIESNQIRVYDSSNVLRVRMGVW